MKKSNSRIISRYIVSDSRICHGQPTFRGTRILVADVLDQVAAGMDWQSIIEDWHESITEEAIREAIDLAARALIKHADDFVLNPASA
jgi:uncharacterized protein (DUF433 family)